MAINFDNKSIGDSAPPMDRVVVVGTSGSGKSTFAKQLAERLGHHYVQLDALHWGPNWTPRPELEFVDAIKQTVADDRWVVDGNYSRHRELIWPHATHVIWLDFSFLRVMYQLFIRTMRRSLLGEELYSGNRESLAKAFFRRDSILLWGLRTYHRRRRDYHEIIDNKTYPEVDFIVLDSPQETEEFLSTI